MFQRWMKLSGQKSALLLGPRRAGKTTFLQKNFPEFHYASLDDFDVLQLARTDPKGLVESLGQTFILDEVQRVPELSIAIKYAIDQQKAFVLMTGSSRIGLLDQTADTLAGRIEIHHLPTACWGEDHGAPTHQLFFETVPALELAQAQRQLKTFLRFGGFPEILASKDDSQKAKLLKDYRDSYFTRDLAQFANIENVEGLMAILMHLARSTGSHLEVSNFARESGLSYPTAKKYLNVLFQSDLAFKLYGYQFGPAKRYLKASKAYFADVGILTALNVPLTEGQIFESFVISELEKRRKLGFFHCDQFFYYQSAGGAEIDLVFEDPKSIYIVEIKSSRNISKRDTTHLRSFQPAEGTSKKKIRKFLIYAGQEYRTIEDVTCLPAAALFRAN